MEVSKMSARVLTKALAVCVGLSAAQAHADSGAIDVNGFKVQRYIAADLSPTAQEAYRGEFRELGYYGAFAISVAPGGTTYGWSNGKSDQAWARQSALEWCERALVRSDDAGPCQLYAEIVPSGRETAHVINGYGVSQITSEGYQEFLEYDDRPFKAFAFTLDGAWAWNSSENSDSEAQSRAMEVCASHSADSAQATGERYTRCQLAN
jgi:hypothetical protein